MRKTKIVCTLGPATDREGVLRKMLMAGMNVARFNFSHGSHEYHRKNIERLKAGTESKTYIWKPRRIHPAGAAPGKDAAPENAPSGAGQAPDKREK